MAREVSNGKRVTKRQAMILSKDKPKPAASRNHQGINKTEKNGSHNQQHAVDIKVARVTLSQHDEDTNPVDGVRQQDNEDEDIMILGSRSCLSTTFSDAGQSDGSETTDLNAAPSTTQSMPTTTFGLGEESNTEQEDDDSDEEIVVPGARRRFRTALGDVGSSDRSTTTNINAAPSTTRIILTATLGLGEERKAKQVDDDSDENIVVPGSQKRLCTAPGDGGQSETSMPCTPLVPANQCFQSTMSDSDIDGDRSVLSRYEFTHGSSYTDQQLSSTGLDNPINSALLRGESVAIGQMEEPDIPDVVTNEELRDQLVDMTDIKSEQADTESSQLKSLFITRLQNVFDGLVADAIKVNYGYNNGFKTSTWFSSQYFAFKAYNSEYLFERIISGILPKTKAVFSKPTVAIDDLKQLEEWETKGYRQRIVYLIFGIGPNNELTTYVGSSKNGEARRQSHEYYIEKHSMDWEDKSGEGQFVRKFLAQNFTIHWKVLASWPAKTHSTIPLTLEQLLVIISGSF